MGYVILLYHEPFRIDGEILNDNPNNRETSLYKPQTGFMEWVLVILEVVRNKDRNKKQWN